MKREILYIIAFCGIVFNGCQKKETVPPVITVIGYSTDTISLNSPYNDLGAQASDNLDVTDVVTSDAGPANPDVNLVGTYIIHYIATNSSGLTTGAARIVVVVNDARKFQGNYLVMDTITGEYYGVYNYVVLVYPSNTVDNLLYLSNFSGLGEDISVTALVVDSPSYHYIAISPAKQVPPFMWNSGAITGGGTVIPHSTITSMKDTINYGFNSFSYSSSTWTILGN